MNELVEKILSEIINYYPNNNIDKNTLENQIRNILMNIKQNSNKELLNIKDAFGNYNKGIFQDQYSNIYVEMCTYIMNSNFNLIEEDYEENYIENFKKKSIDKITVTLNYIISKIAFENINSFNCYNYKWHDEIIEFELKSDDFSETINIYFKLNLMAEESLLLEIRVDDYYLCVDILNNILKKCLLPTFIDYGKLNQDLICIKEDLLTHFEENIFVPHVEVVENIFFDYGYPTFTRKDNRENYFKDYYNCLENKIDEFIKIIKQEKCDETTENYDFFINDLKNLEDEINFHLSSTSIEELIEYIENIKTKDELQKTRKND